MQKKYSQVNSSNRIAVYPVPSKILVMLSMPKFWEWEKMSVEIKSLWKDTPAEMNKTSRRYFDRVDKSNGHFLGWSESEGLQFIED